MSRQPIKATSKDYTSTPFHLIQSNGTQKRYVVSLRDKPRIRTILAEFINQCENFIQVKIRDISSPEEPNDYLGELSKSKIHELMSKHEDVIFHHGFHDLMFRNPESGDHVAFDEHGLIFIYTDQDYSELLKNVHAEYKPGKKLIYEFNHWHYCLPEGQEKLTEMIKDFELEKE